MSKPTDKEPQVQEINDDDDEGAPDLLENDQAETLDAQGQMPGKTSKRYAKAMARMGCKPEPGVAFVQVERRGAGGFAITGCEVYKHNSSNTWVIFGQLQEMGNQDAARAAQMMAQMQAQGANMPPAAGSATETGASATGAAADDDEEVDSEGVGEKEIKLVMAQANVSRAKAVKALKANNNDLVNAIMDLSAE